MSKNNMNEENVHLNASPFEFPEAVADELNAQFESLERAMETESQKAHDDALAMISDVVENSETTDEAEIAALESAEAAQIAQEEEAKQAALDDEKLDLPIAHELNLEEAQASIEALIFMTEKPMSLEKIFDLLSPKNEDGERPTAFSVFQEAYTALKDRYAASHHGFELVEVAGGIQFRTKPGMASFTRKLAKVQVQRLSSGAMETLAIVSYRQPVLKDEIDKVRGVDSSYFIRNLLDRNLIEMSGRSELPGRPILYSTTSQFLQLFGISSLKDLPPLSEIEGMVPASEVGKQDEDPRVKEMRKLVSEMKSDRTRIDYDPREDERILKEIKDRVSSIATSTPYLEEQKAQEAQSASQNA